MNEENLKLLKLALNIAEEMIDKIDNAYCIDDYSSGNDFYYLRKELAEKLGVSYEDLE